METRELIEERHKLWNAANEIVERAAKEKRGLSADEDAKYNELNTKIQEHRATIERIQQLEAEKKELDAARESRGRQTALALAGQPDAALDQELVLRAWALGGNFEDIQLQEMPAAYRDLMRDACQRIGFDPRQKAMEVRGPKPGEKRALSAGNTSAGGYSVPDEMMRAYWDIQLAFGSVRSVATVWSTATGADLPVPTTNDTGNTGEIVAEGNAVTTTADPVFGQVVMQAFKYSSKAVIISVELLQDSFIPLPTYLGQKLGERIARIQNTHFTTGDASGKPNGVATAATLGKTASATNAITLDEVIDLQHSVDIAYRSRAAFMMHDLVAANVRKQKDSQGRYQWELSAQVGQPDRLFGAPVIINNDMSSTFSTNNRLMLFGDFKNYLVRDAGGPIFARADELRILNHQVVFLSFQRSDGDLIDTTSVRYLRTA